MGVLALTNGYANVNAVDLSDHAHQITFDQTADAPETTAFNSASVRSYTGGLKSATGSIQFRQDFASNKVDATLAGLIGTVVAIKLRAVNDTIAATNPEYQFNAVITGYQPVQGGVGDTLDTQLSFTVTGAVTRATS